MFDLHTGGGRAFLQPLIGFVQPCEDGQLEDVSVLASSDLRSIEEEDSLPSAAASMLLCSFMAQLAARHRAWVALERSLRRIGPGSERWAPEALL